jgi:hypothetical protein
LSRLGARRTPEAVGAGSWRDSASGESRQCAHSDCAALLDRGQIFRWRATADLRFVRCKGGLVDHAVVGAWLDLGRLAPLLKKMWWKVIP